MKFTGNIFLFILFIRCGDAFSGAIYPTVIVDGIEWAGCL